MPMTDSERLARIEQKVDSLVLRFDDFRVVVEQRVSRLETKAAIWGAGAAIVVAAVAKALE